MISRIVYSLKGDNLKELQQQVDFHHKRAAGRGAQEVEVRPEEVLEVQVAGNTTMSHLFLGITPRYVREQPYIPAVNHYPRVPARELGLASIRALWCW